MATTVRRPSQEEIAAAYQRLLTTADGMTILADIAARFGYQNRTLFVPDPYRTAFNEGQRSVAVHIGRMLSAAGAEEDARRGELEIEKEGD